MEFIIVFCLVILIIVNIATYYKTEQVHKATNSMKDELVFVTRTDALARGRLEGAASQRAEDLARK